MSYIHDAVVEPRSRGFWAVVLLASCLAAPATAQTVPPAPPFAINDLDALATLSEPAFAPDGETIVYTLTSSDRAEDLSVSDLWRASWSGGAPRRLTTTNSASEWSPQVSADGGDVFFLSDRAEDGSIEVWTMPLDRGSARRVTDFDADVEAFSLSPDGRRLVVSIATGNARAGFEDAPEATQPPLVVDRFLFKADGSGRLDGRRRQLHVVDAKSGASIPLTSGPYDHDLPAWSPRGDLIAFVAQTSPEPARDLNYDVFVIAPEVGAEPRRLGDFEGADHIPEWGSPLAWSPDGTHLAWLRAGPDDETYYASAQLVVADVASGEAAPLAWIDRWIYQPTWSADGEHIIALIEQDRDTWAAEIDVDTGAIAYLTEGPRFAVDLAVSRTGRIAVIEGDVGTPYELRSIEAAPRVLASHNAWLEARRLAPIEDVSWTSGDETIHGFYVAPLDAKFGSPPPLIVALHGGPVYQFSHEFMSDWQLYAAAGYAVFAPNPRGSSGRGSAFSKAIYADWGGPDGADVIAGVNALIAQGRADETRLGVTGWSYGGILTNALIATDPRFKAAVSGAGMSNFLGGYGVDQYPREYELELGRPWEDASAWLRVSFPFFEAERIEAAAMFVCAEEDDNVPCVGAEHMYQALKSLGRDTRLVVYPGETHSLETPSYVRDYVRRTLAWFDEHLSAAPSEP